MIQELLPVLSVLIVEDQPDAAESTADLLALHGHRVRIARSGPDALQSAASETPDVVLMDIGLPGMDGWEVTKRMRARASRKQPFVVAVTGYGAESDRRRSADVGVDLHVLKPADPVALAELLGWVREVISKEPAGEPEPRMPIPSPAAGKWYRSNGAALTRRVAVLKDAQTLTCAMPGQT